MRLATFRHDGRGFTVPWLPALDSEQTLVLAFAGADRRCDLDPRAEPMRELRRAYPRSHFLVATGGAAGSPPNSPGDDSIAIAVACFEWTTLRSTSLDLGGSRPRRGDLHAAGARIARALLAPGLRGVLLLAEAGRTGGRELVSGLDGALPPRVAISGLMTSSGAATASRVAAIGFFGGELQFRHERHGPHAADEGTQLVTTLGEGGTPSGDVWGDRLLLVAGAESIGADGADASELCSATQTVALRASATYARAARAPTFVGVAEE